MKADALHDLIRTVDDASSPEHKAIFHLWSALDDVASDVALPHRIGRHVDRGLALAAAALRTKGAPENHAEHGKEQPG